MNYLLNETFVVSIIGGAISSILTLIILQATKFSWNQFCVNVVHKLQNRNIDIYGEWIGATDYDKSELFKGTEDNHLTYKIKCRGSKVYGTADCCAGPSRGSKWALNGKICNSIVNLTFEPSNEIASYRGTVSLWHSNDHQNNRTFEGYLCFSCDEHKCITHAPIRLKKVN